MLTNHEFLIFLWKKLILQYIHYSFIEFWTKNIHLLLLSFLILIAGGSVLSLGRDLWGVMRWGGCGLLKRVGNAFHTSQSFVSALMNWLSSKRS